MDGKRKQQNSNSKWLFKINDMKVRSSFKHFKPWGFSILCSNPFLLVQCTVQDVKTISIDCPIVVFEYPRYFN